MAIIHVSISSEGYHRHITIKLFGLTLFHRHDFTKTADKSKTVGFNIIPSDQAEVEDEDYCQEECKNE